MSWRNAALTIRVSRPAFRPADAITQVNKNVALPQGYRLDWGGEYTEYLASRGQLQVILPLTLFLIFLLLFALYSNLKFPFIHRTGRCAVGARGGGILALWLTGTPFWVSSGIGFLARDRLEV